VQQVSAYLQAHGYSAADASKLAYARFYAQLEAQTRFLGFMDCFWVIGVLTLVTAPIVLLTKNFKVSGGPAGGH